MASAPRQHNAEAPRHEDLISLSFEPPPEDSKIVADPKADESLEYDEFGLPIKKQPVRWYNDDDDSSDDDRADEHCLKDARAPSANPAAPEDTPTIAPPRSAAPAPASPPVSEAPAAPPTKPSSPAPATDPAPPAYSPAMTAVEDKLARTSLSEKDRQLNEQKMFSEDPSAPKLQPLGTTAINEYSHQTIVPRESEIPHKKEEPADLLDDDWQEMPAYASTDLYDDNGRLIAKAHEDSDAEENAAVSKGYTRVFDDEDAESVTSMDENTKYLFNDDADDEGARNPLAQMQATKNLLTEGQRIAYVGVCKLTLMQMVNELQEIKVNGRAAKKTVLNVVENMRMWSQKIMVRLYTHMEISPPEQIMIEQLSEHGVLPSDLTPTLMVNSTVDNPMADDASSGYNSPRPSSVYTRQGTPTTTRSRSSFGTPRAETPPPAYQEHVELEEVKTPSELPQTKTINIDLRWTVLCDLFLVLVADSVYDARARTLLERVGKHLGVDWLDICKFEKRVTDAMEMQESADQNWAEREHMENRDKKARNKRLMIMGLATVGGGLVIGLSGGLLAPFIGAGLAAGLGTIGVAGTGAFLGGTAGTAMIATGAVVSGSYVGGKAGFNRMKSVKTFEFKPLHNAKRMNLIITVSGWMNGKVDDVRLPFSTVDPIMGDIFSIFWEPEMLQSTGQTINILATEVLTQSLQQVLGQTILMSLMSAIQLPMILTKLAYLLDNPWSVSLERAQGAGLILADTLIHRNLGVRPVTLVGYSLGARVIYYCLRELARVGASGLVQNVYMFGTPVVVKKDDYAQAVSVVSGRVVNGYAKNDWILGYLFRATSGGIGRVAGLAPVTDIPGVENVDLTELVPGHMAYRQAMPRVLRFVGWEVTSDEFSEIEDPDPDNHQERQRELINELEEARKELEQQPQKKKFLGLFNRKAGAQRKNWETYEPADPSAPKDPREPEPPRDNVLFDLDAIRAEIAREQQSKGEVLTAGEVREAAAPQREGLRQTKSYNDVAAASAGEYRQRNASSAGYAAFGGAAAGAAVGGAAAWGWDEYDEEADGEVQLSFEPGETAGEVRAGIERAYSTPAVGAGNVWADDEYDEFQSGEGEMTLSFA